ncbi:acetylornithine/succinyldiaminopimelate/putrescine aminotransferase [Bradyrhizobium sp. LM3.2]
MTTHPYDALMDITARPKAVFVRGAGSYLWDDSRKRYLDFVQGWAVNCLGHSPPAIADALAAQAKRLLTPSPAFYNEPSLKLAQALVANSAFDQVFFANSGAEANEGAIKLARKYGSLHRGGAFEIISFERVASTAGRWRRCRPRARRPLSHCSSRRSRASRRRSSTTSLRSKS